jgi:hypothetical protein
MGREMCGNQAKQCQKKTSGEEKVKQKDMRPALEGHTRALLTLGEKVETAEAHSSTSLRGLLGGSIWVLTKVGVLGDGGTLVRLFLCGEPIPEPGCPGTGCG